MEVSFHFVKYVFRGTSQEDRAGSWGLAVNEITEVVIPNLADIKESALSTHVRLLDLFRAVDDLRT